MIRFFDIIFSLLGLILLFPIILVLIVLGFFDSGHPIFSQKRVGKSKVPFFLYKFRSMKLYTVSVATHLSSKDSITKYGSFLRRSKLDELPQLLNVLKGDQRTLHTCTCASDSLILKNVSIRLANLATKWLHAH